MPLTLTTKERVLRKAFLEDLELCRQNRNGNTPINMSDFINTWRDMNIEKRISFTNHPRRKITLEKLRTAIVMRENGCSYAEIASVIGISATHVCQWFNKLKSRKVQND